MLEQKLKFLDKYLARKDVAEIIINRPGEIVMELRGTSTWVTERDAAVTWEALYRLGRVIANKNNVTDFKSLPKISALLPGRHRLELVLADAADHSLACAIRMFTHEVFNIDNFLPRQDDPPYDYKYEGPDNPLRDLLREAKANDHARERLKRELTKAVRSQANIIVSGGTSSGKTQLSRSLLTLIPENTRIIIIQDTPELDIDRFKNGKLFTVNREATSQNFGYAQAMDACTRLRPDRIILGEITMDNAWIVLRLLNTGHGGFMTTVHADKPTDAPDAIAKNIMLMRQIDAGNVVATLRNKIDLVIQIKRIETENRTFRRIVDIYKKAD